MISVLSPRLPADDDEDTDGEESEEEERAGAEASPQSEKTQRGKETKEEGANDTEDDDDEDDHRHVHSHGEDSGEEEPLEVEGVTEEMVRVLTGKELLDLFREMCPDKDETELDRSGRHRRPTVGLVC